MRLTDHSEIHDILLPVERLARLPNTLLALARHSPNLHSSRWLDLLRGPDVARIT